MYRWFIALKYLTSRFITFAALLTVACGVALLIVILSVMEGFRVELEDRIRGTSADIRVESKSLIGLKDPPRVASRVREVPGVRSVAPYIESLAMCRPQGDSESFHFFLQAMDLAEEARVGGLAGYLENARDRGQRAARGETPRKFEVFGISEAMLGGQPADVERLLSPEWLENGLWKMVREERPPGPLPPPLLIGWEAMINFQLKPGRIIQLTSYSPLTHRARSSEFLIAGVFLSRDYQQDSRVLLMPLQAAVDFLDLRGPAGGPPGASGLRVRIGGGAELTEVEKRIQEALAEVPFVDVRTWREEKASLLRAVRIEKTLVGIILGVLILFAGLMIFIVLTVQVVEKTRDLGVLQSLGSTSWGIARIYLLIGSGVCLVGTVLGAVVGVAFSLSINGIQRWIFLLVGFDLFPRNVYYIERIPVRLAPVDLLFIIAPTVLASLVASVIPAFRAARKDPVVALRYE